MPVFVFSGRGGGSGLLNRCVFCVGAGRVRLLTVGNTFAGNCERVFVCISFTNACSMCGVVLF